MKNYYRIMLGRGSKYAEECYNGNFIGADLSIKEDLTSQLPDDWREFNRKFIPIWLQNVPGKTKISAGLACGALHTISKGLQIGDIVLCPNGARGYYVGEISSLYKYHPERSLQHCRDVKWYSKSVDRSEMSQALQNSTGAIGTVSNITKHAKELEALISGSASGMIVTIDETIEDPSVFALEKHLEDFLVHNWGQTDLGKEYDVYEEDGELAGQQYPTDTGAIDILAMSKNKKELLVVELKKGRASDSVVGQIQRYMGYVKEELAEEGQIVKGVIIALEDDVRIQRALSVTNNIDFYKYQVSFKLIK